MFHPLVANAPQFTPTAEGFNFIPLAIGAVVLAVIYTVLVVKLKKGTFDTDDGVTFAIIATVAVAFLGWFLGSSSGVENIHTDLATWIQEEHPDIRVSAHADELWAGMEVASPDTHKNYALYEVAPDVWELMEAPDPTN